MTSCKALLVQDYTDGGAFGPRVAIKIFKRHLCTEQKKKQTKRDGHKKMRKQNAWEANRKLN